MLSPIAFSPSLTSPLSGSPAPHVDGVAFALSLAVVPESLTVGLAAPMPGERIATAMEVAPVVTEPPALAASGKYLPAAFAGAVPPPTLQAPLAAPILPTTQETASIAQSADAPLTGLLLALPTAPAKADPQACAPPVSGGSSDAPVAGNAAPRSRLPIESAIAPALAMLVPVAGAAETAEATPLVRSVVNDAADEEAPAAEPQRAISTLAASASTNVIAAALTMPRSALSRDPEAADLPRSDDRVEAPATPISNACHPARASERPSPRQVSDAVDEPREPAPAVDLAPSVPVMALGPMVPDAAKPASALPTAEYEQASAVRSMSASEPAGLVLAVADPFSVQEPAAARVVPVEQTVGRGVDAQSALNAEPMPTQRSGAAAFDPVTAAPAAEPIGVVQPALAPARPVPIQAAAQPAEPEATERPLGRAVAAPLVLQPTAPRLETATAVRLPQARPGADAATPNHSAVPAMSAGTPIPTTERTRLTPAPLQAKAPAAATEAASVPTRYRSATPQPHAGAVAVAQFQPPVPVAPPAAAVGAAEAAPSIGRVEAPVVPPAPVTGNRSTIAVASGREPALSLLPTPLASAAPLASAGGSARAQPDAVAPATERAPEASQAGPGQPLRTTRLPLQVALSDATPLPLAAGTTAPAFRLFADALHAARAEDREQPPMPPVAAPAPTAVASTGGEGMPLDMTDGRWPQAMVDRIEGLRDAAAAAKDAASTSIRLAPDALGTIDVSVRSEGDTVHVHFAAEQAQTRVLITDAQPRLQELAEARGLRLAGGDVGANSQGQRQPTQQPTHSPAPRTAARAEEPELETTTRIA